MVNVKGNSLIRVKHQRATSHVQYVLVQLMRVVLSERRPVHWVSIYVYWYIEHVLQVALTLVPSSAIQAQAASLTAWLAAWL